MLEHEQSNLLTCYRTIRQYLPTTTATFNPAVYVSMSRKGEPPFPRGLRGILFQNNFFYSKIKWISKWWFAHWKCVWERRHLSSVHSQWYLLEKSALNCLAAHCLRCFSFPKLTIALLNRWIFKLYVAIFSHYTYNLMYGAGLKLKVTAGNCPRSQPTEGMYCSFIHWYIRNPMQWSRELWVDMYYHRCVAR